MRRSTLVLPNRRGPKQCRDAARRDALDERVEQVVAARHLVWCERPLERERRRVHAAIVGSTV